jgi:hypothetical protein
VETSRGVGGATSELTSGKGPVHSVRRPCSNACGCMPYGVS